MMSRQEQKELNVLVLPCTDVRHVTPVVDSINMVGGRRRVEDTERLVGVEDESQVVDFSLFGGEMNDVYCPSV